MSIPLEAIVGDVHVVGGVRQSITAPTATLQPPRRVARGRSGDRLFVLVELRPPDLGADIELYHAPYNKIIDQIAAAYWRTEGSVTAALRAAITAANDWLMDYNLNAPVRERFRAGVTCAAMRQADVFIAQAGPAACYVAHQGRVERFPSRDVAAPALGASRGVEVRYSHAELHPGDVVLLCDSLTAEHTSDDAIANAIVYVGAPAALANLERLVGSGDLIALVIEGAAESKKVPDAKEPAVAPARQAAPPPPIPEPIEPETAPEIAHTAEPGPSLRERLADMWARLRRPTTPTRPPIPRDDLVERARQVVRSVIVGLLVAGRDSKAFLQRMLPEQSPRSERSAPGSALIGAGLTIIIPLLITALVVSTFMQRRQQAEFESLLNAARAQAAEAQNSTDERDARAKWQSAMEHANEALDYHSDNIDALAIRNQAMGQLDRIDRVTRIKSALLFDFGAVTHYDMAAQSVNVFVMNDKNLWHITLNETGSGILEGRPPPISAYAGAAISGRQIGDLLDLTWVGADGLRTKSSLLILDTGGLLEYDPAWNVRAVQLGQGETRSGLRLMAAFGGNLYVLDSSQLWRYKPLGDGFGTAPETYFNTPPGDLSTVVDMAIDGSVYLLYADGRIRRFFGGDEQPFTPTDLSDPLAQPVALAADAEATRGSLYVADAARARIVQFTSQGIFMRQLKSYDSAMDALENILVDERAQRIFFLSGGKLYTAPLPSMSTP